MHAGAACCAACAHQACVLHLSARSTIVITIIITVIACLHSGRWCHPDGAYSTSTSYQYQIYWMCAVVRVHHCPHKRITTILFMHYCKLQTEPNWTSTGLCQPEWATLQHNHCGMSATGQGSSLPTAADASAAAAGELAAQALQVQQQVQGLACYSLCHQTAPCRTCQVVIHSSCKGIWRVVLCCGQRGYNTNSAQTEA